VSTPNGGKEAQVYEIKKTASQGEKMKLKDDTDDRLCKSMDRLFSKIVTWEKED